MLRIQLTIGELERRGAIVEIQDGNHGEKHPVAADYVSEGVPFLMASDLKDGVVDLVGCKFITAQQAASLRIGFARTGDVLLTHKGTVGNVAVLPQLDCYAILTPQITYYRVDEKQLSHLYLRYAFSAPDFQARLKAVSAQSTRPYIGITAQRNLEITWVDRQCQEGIASILSAYDNLIENNTRRIKILEQIAQMIYREWFVRFRFPGNENVRMVESELGLIPEGWDVERLESVVEEFIDYRGKTPKKLGGDWSDAGIIALSALNVKQGRLINLDKARFVSEDLYGRWMKSELRSGDVLMTSEAPLGEVYFLAETRRFCLSQRVFAIRSKPGVMQPSLLFFFLSSPEGQERLKARASGTTVLGIRQADLRRIPLVRPPAELQERADSILRPFLKLIDVTQGKIDNLALTKDFLLPKLLSGEISVETASETTAELVEANA